MITSFTLSLEAGYSSGSEEDPREGSSMERKKNPIKLEMLHENSHSFDLIQTSNFFLYSNPQLRPQQDDIQLRDEAVDFYLPTPLIVKRPEGF